MAQEFYADNKRVSTVKAKAELGFAPAYPTYREGLRRWRRRARVRPEAGARRCATRQTNANKRL